jgi:hypothetical protein
MKPVLVPKNCGRSEVNSVLESHTHNILQLKKKFKPTIKETQSPLEFTLAAAGISKFVKPFRLFNK